MTAEFDFQPDPVFIIESPSPEDVAAGRQEARALASALTLMGVPVKHYTALNPQGFEEAFIRIADAIQELPEAIRLQLMPYIHISAHGGQDGFTLQDGEEMLWEDVRDLLNELNERLGFVELPPRLRRSKQISRLTLCLSTCEGYAGTRIHLHDPSPYQALVGPLQELDWPVALVAFQVFYLHALFNKTGIAEAVDKMNRAMDSTVDFQYALSPELDKVQLHRLGHCSANNACPMLGSSEHHAYAQWQRDRHRRPDQGGQRHA